MRKFFRILIILCGVLFLISCNKLEEGYVIEKWYEPTNSYIMNAPITISTGTSTKIIMVPHIITDFEDWCVKIKGEYKNKERVETVYVTQEQYENLSIGSYLRVGDGISFTDDNNHKVRK